MDYSVISIVLEFVSILFLICGAILLTIRPIKTRLAITLFLYTIALVELIFLVAGEFRGGVNIYLVPFFDLIDLIFLSFIYQRYFLRFSNKTRNIIVVSGILLLLIGTLFNKNIEEFQLYINVCFQLLFVIYALLYLNNLLISKVKLSFSALLFNLMVVVFFSVDAIISLSINYLINEHLSLVAPFWIFRLLLLQIFYVSLIYFGWEIGKTQK